MRRFQPLFDCILKLLTGKQQNPAMFSIDLNRPPPEGAQAVFISRWKENTGFVPSRSLNGPDGQEQEFPDVSEEGYRYFNRINREIVQQQGVI